MLPGDGAFNGFVNRVRILTIFQSIRPSEKLNAAVMAPPFEGRPGFPETHSLFQGGLLSGTSSICKQLQGYDLVVVIGAPVFRYYPYAPGAYLPEGTRLILLTDSPEEVARAVAGDGIVCDPARACATLVELLPKATRKPPEPRNPLPAPEVKDKITADYVCYTVAKLRPKNSVITQEAGHEHGFDTGTPTALGTQILLLLVHRSSRLWVASGHRCRPGRARSRHESQGHLATG